MPKQMLHRRLVPLFLIAAFFFGCFLCFLTTRLFSDTNRDFQDFTLRIFREQAAGNTLSLHYTLADPEQFNITATAPSFGHISRSSFAQAHAYLENQNSQLQQFDPTKLNRQNRLTHSILSLYLRTELSPANQYLLNEILSPGLGIQAQLPVLLAEYTFRTEDDIRSYLELLKQTDTYFSEILAFEQEKSAQGYFMNDYTLDGVLSQCRDFLSDGNNNYLGRIFHNKLLDFPGLSTSDITFYEKQHQTILSEHVLPAYTLLSNGLEALRGTGTNPNGLYYYSNGAQYYTWLLQSTTGVYDSLSLIEKRLLAQLQQDQKSMQQLLSDYPDLSSRSLSLGQKTASDEPAQILADLTQKIESDFPPIPAVSYEVKYVDENLRDHLSPAFYLTPPLDTMSPNTIYINPASNLSGLDLYTTLAHEGFPGHLYQTQYFCATSPDPIRCLMNMGGYIEGWATYVESFAYRYADCSPEISAAAWLNRSMNLCLFSICDMGIHNRGWTQAQTGSFLKNFGITDPDIVSSVFHNIVSDPANYLKYYLGYLSFLDIRSRAMSSGNKDFDLRAFHKKILETGPCQFPVLSSVILAS